jgi:hypothetical protein
MCVCVCVCVCEKERGSVFNYDFLSFVASFFYLVNKLLSKKQQHGIHFFIPLKGWQRYDYQEGP